METSSYLVIAFVVAIMFYVEMLMGKKPLTEKEISDYQLALDKVRDALKGVNHGFKLNLDAKTELLSNRNTQKAFALIFTGIGLGLLMVILLVVAKNLSLTNIFIMCISAVMLICYGRIKMAESKRLAIELLIFILICWVLVIKIFDKMTETSPAAYLYLCAIIALIALFGLFKMGQETKEEA